MAEAMPPLPVVIVIVDTLTPAALMKLAPLSLTGMVRVTTSLAPELVPPVTVAVMTLVCPPLTEVGDAARARTAPAGPALRVIQTAFDEPFARPARTVS